MRGVISQHAKPLQERSEISYVKRCAKNTPEREKKRCRSQPFTCTSDKEPDHIDVNALLADECSDNFSHHNPSVDTDETDEGKADIDVHVCCKY